MREETLEETVRDELLALRKDSGGVTVDTLARAGTLCRLLGAGDPYVAYSRLQHFLLNASSDRTVQAAAASLGFAAEGDTHLDRLVEAGSDLHLEQRQVRRLSDKGLRALARLIVSNWAVESVPELTAIVTETGHTFEIIIVTVRPLVIEMSTPRLEILTGSQRAPSKLEWTRELRDEQEQTALRQPIIIPRTEADTSVVIVWRGELWPKFTTVWRAARGDLASESLGNKLMLRLVGVPGGKAD